MSKKVKKLVSAAAFLLIFAILFSLATYVLRDKRYASNALALYEEPKHSADVLFAGSSHMLNGVFPLEIYNETGIVGLNIGQNAQLLPETYYALQEAFRYQTPELVVLDVYMLYEQKKVSTHTSLHFTLDTMSLGLPKLQAIWDLAEKGQRGEYLLDIITYHTRWKELEGADFRPLRNDLKGCEPIFATFDASWFAPIDRDVTAPLEGVSFEYFEKILALCEKQGVQVLLTALPFAEDERDPLPRQELVNAAMAYAEEKGIPFLHYNYLLEEVGLDPATDFSNIDHLNGQGAVKLSRHLGQYLAEHFDLPDHRTDSAYGQWNEAYRAYVAYLEEN